MPLAAVSSTRQIRQRSNTVNSDSMDPEPIRSSMLPAIPSTQPPRRKPRAHPTTTRPHSRQRSRDIERGSPVYQSQVSPTGVEPQGSWIWPDSAKEVSGYTGQSRMSAGHPQSMYDEPEALTPPVPAQDVPSMYVTEPSGQVSPEEMWAKSESPMKNQRNTSNSNTRKQARPATDNTSSGSSNSIGSRPRSSSYTRPSIRPISSQTGSASGSSFTGRFSRTRKATPPQQQDNPNANGSTPRARTSSNATTDGDVSASELMDVLGDLEPVANANASSSASRTGVSTPGERAKEVHVMRKRSLSSEGERFPE